MKDCGFELDVCAWRDPKLCPLYDWCELGKQAGEGGKTNDRSREAQRQVQRSMQGL